MEYCFPSSREKDFILCKDMGNYDVVHRSFASAEVFGKVKEWIIQFKFYQCRKQYVRSLKVAGRPPIHINLREPL